MSYVGHHSRHMGTSGLNETCFSMIFGWKLPNLHRLLPAQNLVEPDFAHTESGGVDEEHDDGNGRCEAGHD